MLLTGILLSFPPPVGAQACPEALPIDASLEFLGFTIEDLDDGVLDPYNTTKITADFEYQAPKQAWAHEPVQVRVTAEAEEDWIQINPGMSSHLVKPEPEIEDYNKTVSITTTAMLTKPAVQGETATIVFTASAEGGTCVNPVDEVLEPLEFTVGFYEKWTAGFLGETVVHLSITEFAFFEGYVESESNGPLMVEIVLENPPEHGTLLLPKPFTVQAGERVIFDVNYQAESSGWDEIAIRLEAESVKGPERELRNYTLTAMVGTQGPDWNYLPSAPIAAVLTVVAVAVLALRKRP